MPPSPAARPGPRALALLLALGLLGAGACERERGPRFDRARLLSRLNEDMIVAATMSQADDLVVQRRGREALSLLEAEVSPRAKANAEAAAADRLVSPWGRARGAEVKQLLDDRREAVDAYVAAIKSDDAERVVTVLESQKALEQRAEALSSAVKSAPEARGGCGGL